MATKDQQYTGRLYTQAEVDELTKAFGGCKKCYGKGYATFRDGITAYADFGDEFGGRSHVKTIEQTMVFCSCGRGEQLSSEVDRMVREARLGMLDYLDQVPSNELMDWKSLFADVRKQLEYELSKEEV